MPPRTRRQPTPPFRLIPLTESCPVGAFTSGTRSGAAEIDEYFRSLAIAEQTSGLSSVTVAINPAAVHDAEVIVGFFTLSPLSIPLSSAVLDAVGMTGVPYRSIGGYLLGRLGVAKSYQGNNYGAALVASAIQMARRAQHETGGVFLAVDAKNDALVRWYAKLEFGFVRLERGRSRLVMRL
jgi:GNAT superfamily N-acetyltransferase